MLEIVAGELWDTESDWISLRLREEVLRNPTMLLSVLVDIDAGDNEDAEVEE